MRPARPRAVAPFLVSSVAAFAVAASGCKKQTETKVKFQEVTEDGGDATAAEEDATAADPAADDAASCPAADEPDAQLGLTSADVVAESANTHRWAGTLLFYNATGGGIRGIASGAMLCDGAVLTASHNIDEMRNSRVFWCLHNDARPLLTRNADRPTEAATEGADYKLDNCVEVTDSAKWPSGSTTRIGLVANVLVGDVGVMRVDRAKAGRIYGRSAFTTFPALASTTDSCTSVSIIGYGGTRRQKQLGTATVTRRRNGTNRGHDHLNIATGSHNEGGDSGGPMFTVATGGAVTIHGVSSGYYSSFGSTTYHYHPVDALKTWIEETTAPWCQDAADGDDGDGDGDGDGDAAAEELPAPEPAPAPAPGAEPDAAPATDEIEAL